MDQSGIMSSRFSKRIGAFFGEHLWDFADRTFKLLSWALALGVALALAKQTGSATAIFVVRCLIGLWLLTLFRALFDTIALTMGILFGPDDFRIVSLKAFVVVVVGLGVFVFVAGGALPAILETVYGFINAVQAQKGG